MTLWERVERWRDLHGGYSKWAEATKAYKTCAADLEADLRELLEIVEQVPHTEGSGIKQDGHSDACPRCALEERIGQPK